MVPRPKILFVTISLGEGGAERHLVRIANVLVDRFEIHIAVLRAGGSYESMLNPSITTHHVGSPRIDSALANCQLSIGKLSWLIRRLKPACCVSFLEPATHALHCALKWSKTQTPHIVAIQNNLDMVLDAFKGWRRWWFVPRIKAAISQADHIIAISSGVADDLRTKWPSQSANIEVIYNAAVDAMPNFDSSVLPLRNRFSPPRKLLVACGRLTRQKGFGDLLEAVALIRRSIDAGLWILGEGPDREELTEHVRRLGLVDSVHFLGFQDHPLRYFAAADLFVLSSWWEGFGNVIVEAMSAGTAVVATDCPWGPGEIITSHENGFLVGVKKPQELADTIVATLKNPDLCRQVAVAGQRRAEDFTANRIANQYADSILSVIERTP